MAIEPGPQFSPKNEFDKSKLKFEKLPYVKGAPKEGSYTYEDGGEHWVVNAGERAIMMANYNGVRVPFYQSTNSGGKAETDAGKWYPFFGVKDSFINKTHGSELAEYYGSPHLRGIAEFLDEKVGSQMRPTDKVHETTGKPIYEIDPEKKVPRAGVKGAERAASAFNDHINSAMQHPVGNEYEGDLVRANIADVTKRLGEA